MCEDCAARMAVKEDADEEVKEKDKINGIEKHKHKTGSKEKCKTSGLDKHKVDFSDKYKIGGSEKIKLGTLDKYKIDASERLDDSFDVEAGENIDVLREERRSTGRALATGIIIFLVGLGSYDAAVHGSSGLSALVGGLIIMLLYVISLLYACHRKKKLTLSNEAALEREIEEVIVKVTKSAKKVQEKNEGDDEEAFRPKNRPAFIRTYSIA